MTYPSNDEAFQDEITNNYRRLASAIVIQAIRDKKAKPNPKYAEHNNRDIIKNKKSAENFINGKYKRWCSELCKFVGVDPRNIREPANKSTTKPSEPKLNNWEELVWHYREKHKNGKIS